jgi:hypothetical protein
MKELIMIVLFWIFPYNILGEETGAYLFLCVLILCMITQKKEEKYKFKNVFCFLLLGLTLVATISLYFSVSPIRSLYGVSLLGIAILTFVMLKNEKQDKYIRYSVYSIAILAIFNILYQGIIQEIRIYGNFGYANTYALALFIGLILSEKLRDNKVDFFIKIILMTALFYTGDRTIILTLIIWVIYCTVRIKDVHVLLSFAMGLILYVISAKLDIITIILLPLLVPLLYQMNTVLLKVNKMIIYIMTTATLIPLFILSTNTTDRIKNISFQNASLIERLVSFEDVIRQVPANLFGNGSNSYEYSQYTFKSAFYESKYIHNSFLQYLYDYGIAGFVLFSLIVILGAFYIIKSSNPNKEMYLILYGVISIHSLLNFDLVYPTMWMLLVALVAFCMNKGENSIHWKGTRTILIILGVGSLLMSFHEGTIKVAEWSLKKEDRNLFRSLLAIQSNLDIPDDRIYFIEAGFEKLKFDETANQSYLVQAEEYLSKANKLNAVDPRIDWNRAFVLEKNKKDREAEELWKHVVLEQKFNPEAYRMYEQFLKEKYKNKPNILVYKLNELRNIHNQSRKELNGKAKFLPNQLKESLELTLID